MLLLGVLFNAEVVAAVHTWNISTAYNHCFLVIPIALYLLWDRRFDLVGIAPRPTPAVLLLGLPLALIWLVAERLGIMEGRQLAALSFVELLFLAVLGKRLWWAMAGPLLYLYFLVPFGEFLTPRLQDITTWFIRHGLDILGVPAYIDGYIIEIPQGTFFVAEACAGLRFLIASIAFGCLYALMMYRSPVRRGVFILVSIIVPIIANGFRGLGIVYLGYLLGSAQAAAADHIIYGWIFFSFVILVLIALGLPFRQDHISTRSAAAADEPAGPPLSMRGMLAIALGMVVIAAISPTVAAGLTMATATQAPVRGVYRHGIGLRGAAGGFGRGRRDRRSDPACRLRRRGDGHELGRVLAAGDRRAADGGTAAAGVAGGNRGAAGALAGDRGRRTERMADHELGRSGVHDRGVDLGRRQAGAAGAGDAGADGDRTACSDRASRRWS